MKKYRAIILTVFVAFAVSKAVCLQAQGQQPYVNKQ
jgi:hypothetical protein